jgi:hypothetical protein
MCYPQDDAGRREYDMCDNGFRIHSAPPREIAGLRRSLKAVPLLAC